MLLGLLTILRIPIAVFVDQELVLLYSSPQNSTLVCTPMFLAFFQAGCGHYIALLYNKNECFSLSSGLVEIRMEKVIEFLVIVVREGMQVIYREEIAQSYQSTLALAYKMASHAHLTTSVKTMTIPCITYLK